MNRILYDFEGDDEDTDEYERSLRRLPLTDEEANYDDDDPTTFCWIEGGYPYFIVNGAVCYFDRIRRCRGQGCYPIRYIR